MRHLMSPLDFSVEELDQLMDLANDIEKNPEKYAHACDGKRLATLFYEPSTRTRLSFEAAMMNLGGTVLGFSSANSSSASKGESVADTIRVVSCFANICAMRHPKEGAPLVASMYSRIPVINAGDGGHQHPTQTLTDLLTIRSLKGRLNNLTIGFCGDLKFGRTVHSLIEALVRYTGIKIVLISPEELRLPDYIRDDVLRANNVPFEEVIKMEDVLPKLDVLYMTRVQKERFFNEDDYIRMKDFYILDQSKMDLASPEMLVLHPLPRVNEISVDVDNDPRAAYFKQVQYGVYARMALILTLLVGSGTSNSGNSNNGNQHNTSSISGFTISSDNLNVASFAERFTPLGPVKFVFSVFGGIVLLIIGLAFILIDIFILAPFEVGGARFFIENSMEKAGLGYMLSGFQNGAYGKTVWTLFLMKLYTFLWSLLLIIPGIVKSYEYRMVPYLLADCPDLSTEDAFRISREMMDGEKMNAFILDLSFIGWKILSSITCGLVGLFYANPYEYATDAELFLILKQNYFSGRSYSNTYQTY